MIGVCHVGKIGELVNQLFRVAATPKYKHYCQENVLFVE